MNNENYWQLHAIGGQQYYIVIIQYLLITKFKLLHTKLSILSCP